MTMPKLPAKPTMTIHVYELHVGARFLIGNHADPDGNGFSVEAYKVYETPDGLVTVDLEGRPLNSRGLPNADAPRMVVVAPEIEKALAEQFMEQRQ